MSMNRPQRRSVEDEPDYLKELLAKAGVDAHAHVLAAKLQKVVMGELHHRVKNTLAIVSAITTQSLRTANSFEDAAKTISERLHALGVAQDLLVRERWTGTGCRTLIEAPLKRSSPKAWTNSKSSATTLLFHRGRLFRFRW
jgi:two-component sensor histidine kinase